MIAKKKNKQTNKLHQKKHMIYSNGKKKKNLFIFCHAYTIFFFCSFHENKVQFFFNRICLFFFSPLIWILVFYFIGDIFLRKLGLKFPLAKNNLKNTMFLKLYKNIAVSYKNIGLILGY